jgi:hypothetical protein
MLLPLSSADILYSAIESLSNSNLPAVIVGGLIGALGPILVTWWGPRVQRKLEARKCALAIAVEIAGVTAVIKAEKICEILREVTRKMKDSGAACFVYFSISAQPFPLYDRDPLLLGLLPRKLVMETAEFFSVMRHLLEGIRTAPEAMDRDITPEVGTASGEFCSPPSKMYSSVPPSVAAPRYRNSPTDMAGTASKRVIRIVAR